MYPQGAGASTLPARVPQVARARARAREHFVLGGALKVFPFPRCTIAPLSCGGTSGIPACRCCSRTHLYKTTGSREWFSSWPGLPRSYEEDSYGIPEETSPNRVARARKRYGGGPGGGRRTLFRGAREIKELLRTGGNHAREHLAKIHLDLGV